MKSYYPIAAALCALPLVLPAQNKLYVDAGAPDGDQDGRSWEAALPSLQEALFVAQPADTIMVKAGTYRTPSEGFLFAGGAALVGGFRGGETSVSQSDPRANPTTLTADVSGDDPASILRYNTQQAGLFDDNAPYVLVVQNTGGDKVVRGLTLTHSYTNPANVSPGGATVAQYNLQSDAELGTITYHECVLRDNLHRVSAVFATTGVFDAGDVARTRFDKCLIADNYVGAGLLTMDASRDAGAQEHLIVTNTEISGNRFFLLPDGNTSAQAYGNVFLLAYNRQAGRLTDKRLAIANSTIVDNVADEPNAGLPVRYIRGVIDLDYVHQADSPQRDEEAVQLAIVNSIVKGFNPEFLVFNPRNANVGNAYFINNELAGTPLGSVSGQANFTRTFSTVGRPLTNQFGREVVFRDAPAGDYRLLPCGVGVNDAASDLSLLNNTDFDYLRAMADVRADRAGVRRVQGGGQDVGAYENPYSENMLGIAERSGLLQVTPALPAEVGLYAFYDCLEGEEARAFTSDPTFLPATNGRYSAQVMYRVGDSEECIWSTNCLDYDGVSGTAVTDVPELSIAPNPVADVLQITAPGVVEGVRVYESTGRLVLEVARGSARVATAGLAPGLYVLEVELDDGRRAVRRFVRE